MLEDYKKKRNFDKTPEPEAKPSKNTLGLRFVIQKHQASHLHYDLRLELSGVLKSWAVPKEPSLDPTVKRLAVHVEDHPFNYKDFEGVIPTGNYGAGIVMIWDEGTYYPIERESGRQVESRVRQEKLLLKQYKEGHLTFFLVGKKLRGEFALIKLKNAKEKNAWLLIKAAKGKSSEQKIIDENSARTGLNLKQIESKSDLAGTFWTSRVKKVEIDAPKRQIPKNVTPMMATLIKEPFDNDEWSFEVKWDGYRAILEIEDGEVLLYSRNKLSFNTKFEEIVNAVKNYRIDAVFDGEIVAVDADGKPSFQLLQEYLINKKGNLIYYLFDILYFDGKSLVGLTYKKRREILRKVIPKVPNIKLSEEIESNGKLFFESVKKENLEGIIGKKIDSTYQPGKRSKDWVKIKNVLEEEFVIVGFTLPKGSRAFFGSLLLGKYEGSNFKYIGSVGTGFNAVLLVDIYEKLQKITTDKPTVINPPKIKAFWVKPILIAEVKFQEWTKEGSLRQPVFLGLRLDKDAKEVKDE